MFFKSFSTIGDCFILQINNFCCHAFFLFAQMRPGKTINGIDEAKLKSILFGNGLSKTQSAFNLCRAFEKHGDAIFIAN